MADIDMDPRTAESIEAAADLLRLSARIRPNFNLEDHREFAVHCLWHLFDGPEGIDSIEIDEAIRTASRQEGIK